MAITAVVASYLTQGPTQSGQILVNNEATATETALIATGTVILDGTLTAFTFNFIDGTKTLSFTPRAVIINIVGGTSAIVPAVTVGSITTTGCTVNLSAAGTNTQTLAFVAQIIK